MALFVRIEPVAAPAPALPPEEPMTPGRGAGGAKTVKISLDVGKTLGLLCLGLLVLGGALALYLTDKNTAAGAFFALGEAIVVTGFGVVLGENSGATEAARQLS